jgi:hypothetical protein
VEDFIFQVPKPFQACGFPLKFGFTHVDLRPAP